MQSIAKDPMGRLSLDKGISENAKQFCGIKTFLFKYPNLGWPFSELQRSSIIQPRVAREAGYPG